MKKQPKDESQSERFKQAARELGCDDDPGAVQGDGEELASAPPVRNEPSKAQKKGAAKDRP